MSNEDASENEGSGQENVKPTITIAEKPGTPTDGKEKETITIAEKNEPKKP